MMKLFSNIGIGIVLLIYVVLMCIHIYQGNSSITTLVWITVISAGAIGILVVLPIWFAHIHWKLYEKRRRMMK
jgi:Na+/proline symporter